jgi:hypothetical protein
MKFFFFFENEFLIAKMSHSYCLAIFLYKEPCFQHQTRDWGTACWKPADFFSGKSHEAFEKK